MQGPGRLSSSNWMSMGRDSFLRGDGAPPRTHFLESCGHAAWQRSFRSPALAWRNHPSRGPAAWLHCAKGGGRCEDFPKVRDADGIHGGFIVNALTSCSREVRPLNSDSRLLSSGHCLRTLQAGHEHVPESSQLKPSKKVRGIKLPHLIESLEEALQVQLL